MLLAVGRSPSSAAPRPPRSCGISQSPVQRRYVHGHFALTALSDQTAATRRRGAVLERAILDAALEQLSTVGWNGLSMEGVAEPAQTGARPP